ncbi:Similar to CYP4C1: Cytochrome P450 4C1 (Blaberus discoidalis) [Cotesia congregata]|uniref:Similar to CYP4C1: Cytochrome P450 4C1 (Blaberus discoidalis) n=1 Tax=Cotesia congregata TaxID=51543 RepID=A0A8J2H8J3_COTCN|nr:Similar to CYP4C1: Cytochrome P450 4C1 (Blaberus discoidalis) [Cotesia congregata]
MINHKICYIANQKRLSFLNILLSAAERNEGVDDRGIQEEVDTFIFEGHDTTGIALLYIILLLAEHRDIQNRVRAEIEEVLADDNGEVNLNNIKHLKYLECCIKESLRLYPSVVIISRKIQEDLVLKHCCVPKGTILNLRMFDTHRDPNFWPRPNVFDPDRFLPENSVDRHPFSYIPFSAGSRNCIGQKFAMLELKTFMAGLLYNFYLEPQECTANLRLIPELVIRPAHPVYVKFVPINRDNFVTQEKLSNESKENKMKRKLNTLTYSDKLRAIEAVKSGSKRRNIAAQFGIHKRKKWKSRRKILTPAFHLHNLREYMDCFVYHTNHLIKNLKSESGSNGVIKELLPLVTKFTLNTIVVESTTGVVIGEKDMEHYKQSVYEFGETFVYRTCRPWLRSEFLFKLTSKGQQYQRNLKDLHSFTKKIIEERKLYYEETRGKYSDSSMSPNKKDLQSIRANQKRLSFLNILLSAAKRNEGVDDRGIQEENRVRAEIEEVLADNNGEVNFDNIKHLTYLECCIKEGLRLYPSVAIISRKIRKDLTLKHCYVPRGTILIHRIFDTHRNANFWPRPNVFDPDRFLPENSVDRHPFSYIPFSAGSRNCIGQKFAMLELKTFMAGLLYNFYLEPQECTANLRLIPELVIRPAHPVYVKFVPINR